MAGRMENIGGRRGNPLRIAVWGLAASLLLLPAVAMRFTDEVDWTPSDFVTWGAMLAVACGTYELAARAMGSRAYRAGVGTAVATAFLLVWINLAVGIVGSEGNPANLMYAGVLAVGIAGAFVARCRPAGMARAMVATAFAQALVGAIVLGGRMGDEAVVLTTCFVAPWLASAWLFRIAAREEVATSATR